MNRIFIASYTPLVQVIIALYFVGSGLSCPAEVPAFAELSADTVNFIGEIRRAGQLPEHAEPLDQKLVSDLAEKITSTQRLYGYDSNEIPRLDPGMLAADLCGVYVGPVNVLQILSSGIHVQDASRSNGKEFFVENVTSKHITDDQENDVLMCMFVQFTATTAFETVGGSRRTVLTCSPVDKEVFVESFRQRYSAIEDKLTEQLAKLEAAATPAPREWNDATGEYSVEARFKGIEDGKYIIVKGDGTEVGVSASDLSPGDRQYARKEFLRQRPIRVQISELSNRISELPESPDASFKIFSDFLDAPADKNRGDRRDKKRIRRRRGPIPN